MSINKKTVIMLKNAKASSLQLALLKENEKNKILLDFKKLIIKNKNKLILENKKDLKKSHNKISKTLYSRLELSENKISFICQGIDDLIKLPDPVGVLLSKTLLDKELILEKISSQLGVLGIVFESRPDVIPQILTLSLKTSNSVVLKGGKEAHFTNRFFMKLIQQLSLKHKKLPMHWAHYIDSREEFQEILSYPEYVSLIIPRGSNALVKEIQKKSLIPVLGHADGICHLYLHKDASLKKSIPIILDSKTQYPSACNALETLLIDQSRAREFLKLFYPLAQKNKIKLFGCKKTLKHLPQIRLATEKDFKTEWGDLILNIRIVKNIDEAVEHIEKFGSHHTDGILTENKIIAQNFLQKVDSANVYVNTSTRFADGFRYGFGAEVGISTSKLHARGPVGIDGLLTYKYQLTGNGHIVSDYTGKQAKRFQHKKVK